MLNQIFNSNQLMLQIFIVKSILWIIKMFSDRERVNEKVKERTVSLWSYINSTLDLYRNPLYYAQQQVLVPIASMRHIRLWRRLYCRWNPSMRPQVIFTNSIHYLWDLRSTRDVPILKFLNSRLWKHFNNPHLPSEKD